MTNPRGFTIFFAVLTASLALAVGLAIYDLLIRELELSQTARESQYAIYAADTGAECALYWDLHYGVVNSSDLDGSAFATTSPHADHATVGQALCAGQDLTTNALFSPADWTIQTNGPTTTTTFRIASTTLAGPCSIVSVAKAGNPPITVVTSRGYNTCVTDSPLRIERTLEVNY